MNEESALAVGKRLIAEGRFTEAVATLEPAFRSPGTFARVWVGVQLAKALRRAEEFSRALDVLREATKCIETVGQSQEWISKQRMAIFGLASWCLWDRDVAHVDDANLLLDAATKIHKTLVSGGLDLFEEPSPFVIAALKAAKFGLDAGRGAEVAKLLDLLDPKQLDAKRVTLQSGDEMASSRERWYELRAKALILTEQWEQAVAFCEQGQGAGLHHQVAYTLGYRRAQALAGMGRREEARKALASLLRTRREWWVQSELAEIEWALGHRKKAIVTASAAIVDTGVDERSARKLLSLACWLCEEGSTRLGTLVGPLIRQIWVDRGWGIKGEMLQQLQSLPKAAEEVQLVTDAISREVRRELWSVLDQYDPPLIGVASRLLPNGRALFLKVDGRPNDVYARMPRVPIQIGQQVSFRLVDSFDFKRNEESQLAIHLKVPGPDRRGMK
jgi:tetratricopeptide (TPR) repeat protein